jgi:hypothetical protein
MHIFQSTRDGQQYRAVITSDQQIFAHYGDIMLLADEHGINREIVRAQMEHDEFPSPINHDNGIDGAPEDGIWMYDRAAHFVEWLASNPNYNPRRTRAVGSTEMWNISKE